MSNKVKKTSYLKAVFTSKCPKCRQGNLYKETNPYKLNSILDMNETCPVCKQKTELETGFYFGTGYVSYALSVAFLVSFFTAWYIVIGFNFSDNRILWCLGASIASLILLQPVLMRLSRTLWLSWFVPYDEKAV